MYTRASTFGHVGDSICKWISLYLPPVSHTNTYVHTHTFSLFASSEGCSRFDPGQTEPQRPLDCKFSPSLKKFTVQFGKAMTSVSLTLLADRMKEMKEIFF